MKIYKPWNDMLYVTRNSDYDIWYHFVNPTDVVFYPGWSQSVATAMIQILSRPDSCEVPYEDLSAQEQLWILELAFTD